MPKPPKKVSKVLSWSYSRLRDYKACARKAFYKHVQRLKEPPGDAMLEGSYVDHLAEAWSTRVYDKPLDAQIVSFKARYAADVKRMQAGQIPAELETFEEEFAYLRERSSSLRPQLELSFDRSWKLLQPRAWFDTSGGTWLRVKMDVMWDDVEQPRRHVVDYKNGKRKRPEDVEQLELYVIAAFLTAPARIEEVVTTLWYLALGEIAPSPAPVYTRADLPKLMKSWEAKVKPLLADETFAPNPGGECRWCYFSQAKGGPCEAG